MTPDSQTTNAAAEAEASSLLRSPAGGNHDDISTGARAADIEFATVGALILAGDPVRADILGILADADVADTRARFLLTTVRTMVTESVPVDTVSVAAYVESRALLGAGAPRMGIGTFLYRVTCAAPVPVAGPWYAAMTVEAAARRRIAAAGVELIRAADAGSVTELSDFVTDQFLAVLTLLGRARTAAESYA